MKVIKIILTIILFAAFLFFATLFYKTLCLMLLLAVWRKSIAAHLPERYRKWGMRGAWACLLLTLWVAMPRWRINSWDPVRLWYIDKEGNAVHPPLSHYVLSTLLPEAEIVNAGITGVRFTAPLIREMGIGQSLISQVQDDIAAGRIGNFFAPYKRLGLCNPISGVYTQLMNDKLGTDQEAVYFCMPDTYIPYRSYPLVVFCHGYLGNWQLYQGLWKNLGNAIVLSIGTRGLDGIFNTSHIDRIFTFYIPMLERRGFHVDLSQVHLMGLSNGGSAITAAMHSRHARDFKSITTISCNLGGLRRVPCQVNLIGGGRDNSAKLMPAQCRELKRMGVDAALYFDEEENHFILVNQREAILQFLKDRFQFPIVEL